MTTSLVPAPAHALSAPANDPFRPSTSAEAMELAKMMAKDCTGIIPQNFRNNPGAVFMVLRMCSQLNIDPLLAFQHVAVINGKLCLYGNLLWGIVLQYCEDVPVEEATGDIASKNRKWVVRIQRRGAKNLSVGEFSYELADANGYLKKPGQWISNPDLMIRWRARHFAARTAFADVLSGLHFREEVEDYAIKDARTHKPAHKPDAARTIPADTSTNNKPAAIRATAQSLLGDIREATADTLGDVRQRCKDLNDELNEAERAEILRACRQRAEALRIQAAGASAKAITAAVLESGDDTTADTTNNDAPEDSAADAPTLGYVLALIDGAENKAQLLSAADVAINLKSEADKEQARDAYAKRQDELKLAKDTPAEEDTTGQM